MLVDLMIIGSQKSATTTLFDILVMSEKIDGALEKEPDFFSRKDWKDNLDKYHRLFSGAEGKLKLEASTQYTFFPHIENHNIVKDIYNYNPKMKFIYIIRNPIDRIVSAYMHSLQAGFISESIDEVIFNKKYFVDVTRYSEQVEPYIQIFGRDRILIIDFNDVVKTPSDMLLEIEDFLEIDLNINIADTRVHSNKSLNATRIKIRYRPIIQPLIHLSSHLPSPIKNICKRIISRLRFLHGPKIPSKPVLSQESIHYLKQELGSQRNRMEALMGRSLSHWDDL